MIMHILYLPKKLSFLVSLILSFVIGDSELQNSSCVSF